MLSNNLTLQLISRLCPLIIHVSPVSESFGMNLLDLPKTKSVHTAEDAWLQAGLAASALQRVRLLAGSAVCRCAHPLEPGVGPTHYIHFIFSLD